MAERDVLMIAYDFPPAIGIGAGLRSDFFYRYLPEFGWRPQVIALDGGQAPVDRVCRLASLTPWHSPYELTPYGWAYALRRYLKFRAGPVDLVYVSCPPFPQALVAAGYAQRRGVPLVVDFRDAWSLDPYQEGSRLKRALYRYLFPSMERRLLQSTDLLILNTPSALKAYQEQYPQQAKRMAWLPNGYDEGAFVGKNGPEARDHMLLLYAGRFGIGGRSPDNLLQGLAWARQRGCDIRLQILGEQRVSLNDYIGRADLGGAVELLDQVDYPDAVARMCGADVLVLVQAPTRAAVQAIAGKTYDYLRAARPILAIAPPGDNIQLLQRHACRLEHADDDPGAIASTLMRLYADWQQAGLGGGEHPREEFACFERRHLASELAQHFDRLVGGAEPTT